MEVFHAEQTMVDIYKKHNGECFMKVGLIRCIQTEDMCPATACLKVMKEKRLAFDGITEDIEVISINT